MDRFCVMLYVIDVSLSFQALSDGLGLNAIEFQHVYFCGEFCKWRGLFGEKGGKWSDTKGGDGVVVSANLIIY